MHSRSFIASLVFACTLPLCMTAPAQQSTQADRVLFAVDTQQRRTLGGHLPHWAAPQNDLGTVATDVALDHLTVLLARSSAAQAAFEQLLNDQQDRGSPRYQHWLTPQQIGEGFGPTDHDVNAVTQWLASEGLRVDAVSPDRTRITFSGASGMVGHALGTEFHRYRVHTGKGEEQRLSISSEPLIPSALAPVIAAFHGLTEEHFEPQSIATDLSAPLLTGTCSGVVCHVIAPADFVTIFNMQPAYNAGFNGSGVRVAIIGQSRVLASDITAFQTYTGLSATAQPVTIIPNTGTDPGLVCTSTSCDQAEQTLDANRVMGTATGAEADLVVSGAVTAGGHTTDGLTISMQYEVDTLLDPIMTISYGSCEAQAGSSNELIYNDIFSSAAAAGITTFIASGDSGAAACVTSTTPPASPPAASINLLCASQYVTCVGGTEFADTVNTSAYWRSTNGTGFESAIGYIPEGAWNEPLNGSTFQIVGTGGGPSIYVTKPGWQTGTGVPADGARDTPDMSFPAAVDHDGYITCLNNSCAGGSFAVYGGTSLAAPGMAGIMALVVQKMGGPQGNFNPTLYRMAANPSLGVFHDATPSSSGVSSCSVATASMCNNSTPSPTALTGGRAGYPLTTGYDLATGWGSVDVGDLLAAIASSYTLTPASGTLTIASPGIATGNTYSVTATSENSFAGTVPLSCTVTYTGAGASNDLPTCSLNPTSVVLTANGTASTTVTIQTTAATARNIAPRLLFDAGGVLACLLLYLPLGLRKKQRRVSLLIALLAAFALCGGSSGCGGGGTPASGGGGSSLGTTLGNYTVTVSGTFAGTVTSTSFTLTVN